MLHPQHNFFNLHSQVAVLKLQYSCCIFSTTALSATKAIQLLQTPSTAEADVKNKWQGQVIFKSYTVYLAALVYALGLESNGKPRQSDTDGVLTTQVPWSKNVMFSSRKVRQESGRKHPCGACSKWKLHSEALMDNTRGIRPKTIFIENGPHRS